MATSAIEDRQFGIEPVLMLSAIGLLLVSGLVHLWLAPEHFEEAPYLGILFGLEFLGAVGAAVGVYRNRSWGWQLGSVVVLGAIVAYLLRGTVGLPLVESESLFEPVGVLAKTVEILFLIIAAYWWRVARERTASSPPQ